MREIRPSGSVRGVRRKPYPYRDNIHPLQEQRERYKAALPDGDRVASATPCTNDPPLISIPLFF
jgi:hypothetical protein